MKRDEESDNVPALVATWFAGEYTMFDACTEQPEIAWRAIIEISRRSLTDEQKSLLAAGPLETLLAWHGAAFIDRIVGEATHNPRFNHLLGGVWRHDMPEEIWERILWIRKEIF
jgi:hypothetical protein